MILEEQVQLQQSQNSDNKLKPTKRLGIFALGVLLGALATGLIAYFLLF